jgi:hypothetical protein
MASFGKGLAFIVRILVLGQVRAGLTGVCLPVFIDSDERH